MRDIEEFDFCYNTCTYHNRYDGWCHYYNKDVSEIDECNYCKKQLTHGDVE